MHVYIFRVCLYEGSYSCGFLQKNCGSLIEFKDELIRFTDPKITTTTQNTILGLKKRITLIIIFLFVFHFHK